VGDSTVVLLLVEGIDQRFLETKNVLLGIVSAQYPFLVFGEQLGASLSIS